MQPSEHLLALSDNPDLTPDVNLDVLILRENFDTLPLDQQAVLALHVVGFKQREIVKILGVSRTTIWSKKKQALDTLHGLLTGNGQDT